jgi:hypothetical protein
MQCILLIVVVVHVLPAIFWARSTFVLARAGGAGADRLAFPQLGAALATLSGDCAGRPRAMASPQGAGSPCLSESLPAFWLSPSRP